jgi:hypothetical protein
MSGSFFFKIDGKFPDGIQDFWNINKAFLSTRKYFEGGSTQNLRKYCVIVCIDTSNKSLT